MSPGDGGATGVERDRGKLGLLSDAHLVESFFLHFRKQSCTEALRGHCCMVLATWNEG